MGHKGQDTCPTFYIIIIVYTVIIWYHGDEVIILWQGVLECEVKLEFIILC